MHPCPNGTLVTNRPKVEQEQQQTRSRRQTEGRVALTRGHVGVLLPLQLHERNQEYALVIRVAVKASENDQVGLCACQLTRGVQSLAAAHGSKGTSQTYNVSVLELWSFQTEFAQPGVFACTLVRV